jgi:hypothetical protein
MLSSEGDIGVGGAYLGALLESIARRPAGPCNPNGLDVVPAIALSVGVVTATARTTPL